VLRGTNAVEPSGKVGPRRVAEQKSTVRDVAALDRSPAASEIRAGFHHDGNAVRLVQLAKASGGMSVIWVGRVTLVRP